MQTDITEKTKPELLELLEQNREICRNPEASFMAKHLAEGWVELIKEQLRFMENFDD